MTYVWVVFGYMAIGFFLSLFAYAIYLAVTWRRDR